MATHQFRIGIVGASSLLGKELSEELGRTAMASAELVLLDVPDAAGQLQATGDELALIQSVDQDALSGLDFVFFAGTRSQTREYWGTARQNGATVIDLTRELAQEPGAVTWSPWLTGQGSEPDLQTTVVVPAYGASMMLAVVGERLRAAGQEAGMFAATVLVPASEFGRAGMDELHQQTVSLLSFQAVPQEVFGTQVAFNVVGEFAEGAAVSLAAERAAVTEQYARLSQGRLPELAVQLVQVPVFHGYTISLFIELSKPASVADVEQAMRGAKVRVVAEGFAKGEDSTEGTDGAEAEAEAPSNLTAAGQEHILLRVESDGGGLPRNDADGRRFWIWMAGDNLRMATTAAAESALHMRRLRPQGKVQ